MIGRGALIGWLHRNRKWLFSGIGVAVLLAMLNWLFVSSESNESGSQATIEQESSGDQSPNVAGVKGPVIIHNQQDSQ